MVAQHRLKAVLSLEIDLEDFPIPADGDIKTQLKDTLEQLLYDLDGVEVRSIEVIGKQLQSFQE